MTTQFNLHQKAMKYFKDKSYLVYCETIARQRHGLKETGSSMAPAHSFCRSGQLKFKTEKGFASSKQPSWDVSMDLPDSPVKFTTSAWTSEAVLACAFFLRQSCLQVRDTRLANAHYFSAGHRGHMFHSPGVSTGLAALVTHLQYTSTAMRRTRHRKVKAETTIRGMIHSIRPGEGRLIIPEVFFSATREINQSVGR